MAKGVIKVEYCIDASLDGLIYETHYIGEDYLTKKFNGKRKNKFITK